MRILLAEDEKELSNALVTILRHNNYSVDAVYDGLSAAEYIENGDNYDAVILDIMMPKMDGISVLKRIRAGGNAVPVLLLTAKAEVDDRVRGLDSGADDYLTKPFAVKELLARLRSITRRQTQAPDTVLSFGNISLDRTTYEMYSSSGRFRLANKEYQMMELFLANPGQVIPTERFMEKIWGYDTETEISVVWVYVSYLRKKLAALGADIAIRASRNLGYSLEKQA